MNEEIYYGRECEREGERLEGMAISLFTPLVRGAFVCREDFPLSPCVLASRTVTCGRKI
jgi:hypothetical protein